MKLTVNESLRLPDDGEIAMDETGDAETRAEGPSGFIRQIALCRRAEPGLVIGQGSAQEGEKIGMLRQIETVLPEIETFGRRIDGPGHLLKEEDIGSFKGKIVHQRRVDIAAPGIEGNKAHVTLHRTFEGSPNRASPQPPDG